MNELDWTKKLWHAIEEWLYNKDLVDDPKWGYLYIGRERRLWDGTRVDILTSEYAAEVDWAPKWAEAVGQSLWYSQNTDRMPCVVLLVKDFTKEYKHLYRAKVVCKESIIPLWLVDTRASIAIGPNGYKYMI